MVSIDFGLILHPDETEKCGQNQGKKNCWCELFELRDARGGWTRLPDRVMHSILRA
jgi:hypothetical protein